jgi:hypothetical protein
VPTAFKETSLGAINACKLVWLASGVVPAGIFMKVKFVGSTI